MDSSRPIIDRTILRKYVRDAEQASEQSWITSEKLREAKKGLSIAKGQRAGTAPSSAKEIKMLQDEVDRLAADKAHHGDASRLANALRGSVIAFAETHHALPADLRDGGRSIGDKR